MDGDTLIIASIAFLVIIILDLLWLTSMKAMYGELVEHVQGKPLRVKAVGAFIAYAAIFVSMAFIAIPMIQVAMKKTSTHLLWLSLRYAGVLGLVIYAIFNATNIAIFWNYDMDIAVYDTMWGIFVYTISAFLGFTIYKAVK